MTIIFFLLSYFFIAHTYFLFWSKIKVYKGFLLDSRVIDSTWVKAKVYNFHDDEDILYKLFWLDDYKYIGKFKINSSFLIKIKFNFIKIQIVTMKNSQ